MLVLVRVRPLTIKEISVNPVECVRVIDSKVLALVDSTGDESEKKRNNRETQFSFDFVFAKVISRLNRTRAIRRSMMKV